VKNFSNCIKKDEDIKNGAGGGRIEELEILI
jgi:hypothetical protein